METKHTPGPWEAEGLGVFYDDNWVGKAVEAVGGVGREQSEANALLMAAAPELLSALLDLQKEIRAAVKFDVKKHYSLMNADACATKAIRKATGAQ
jgi:hypothetical protein